MTTSKEILARQLWLHYFNRVLLGKGIITQEEYRKLSRQIYSMDRK